MSLRRFGSSEIERAIDGIGRAYFHLPAYAGLAVLCGMSMVGKGSKRRRAAMAFAVATAYGWLLEVAQMATPTRSFNLKGLLFDAAGAAAGAAAAYGFFAWRERAQRRA
jgi:VanZ family protein